MENKDVVVLLRTLAAAALPVVILFLLPKQLRPKLPAQRFRPAPWDGLTVLGVFFVVMISHHVFAGLLPSQWSQPWPLLIASLALIGPQIVLAVATLIPFPYSAQFAPRRIVNNAAIGVIAWSCITPVVYGLQISIQWLIHHFGQNPHQHQFISELRNAGVESWLWLLVGMEAILFAPLREELFFRAVLQPWAIGRQWGGDLMFAFAAIAGYVFIGNVSWKLAIQPVALVAFILFALLMHERFWRDRKPTVPQWWRWLFPELAGSLSITGPQLRRGIVGTSVLFAMMHAENWPDPIPLTALGLGLGWLAWRTQSLVAPVVCHALFNGLALAQLRMLTEAR